MDKDAEIRRLKKALAASLEEKEILKKNGNILRKERAMRYAAYSTKPSPVLGANDVSDDEFLSQRLQQLGKSSAEYMRPAPQGAH